ncbi:hypothetical protein MY4824_000823 [Beauveria thailandica]
MSVTGSVLCSRQSPRAGRPPGGDFRSLESHPRKNTVPHTLPTDGTQHNETALLDVAHQLPNLFPACNFDRLCALVSFVVVFNIVRAPASPASSSTPTNITPLLQTSAFNHESEKVETVY